MLSGSFETPAPRPFDSSPNAELIRNRIKTALSHGGQVVAKHLRENEDRVTDNLYHALPSGDYGRGDVRRVFLETLDTIERMGE